MKSAIGSRPWAGLDVGTYSIKLLALQPAVGGVRHWVAELPIPRPNGGDEMPPVPELARLIGECMTLSGHSPRQFRGVTLGVSGADVIVKQIQLPLMDESEVAGALRFEARKHLPFDPATMVIDYQVLARWPSEKKLDVLLAAVSVQRLEKAIAPLRELGIETDIVDAAPLALTNALRRGAHQGGDAHVMLDIGLAGSWFTLHQKGAPYFSRRLDWGGALLTQAISRATRVPPAEAEEWKLEAGSDSPSMRLNPEAPEMRALAESVLQLADEVRRSFAFYRTLGPLPDPLTLWISGSTARLPGIAGQLSESVGVPVVVFSPLDALGGAPAGGIVPGGPQFAQAYGLALRVA